MQSSINVAQAFGMVGEMYDLTPRRVDAKEVAADVYIGGVAGVKPADGSVATMASSTYTKFLGIFVRAKEQISYGGSTPLEASLKVPAGCTVQVCEMGRCNVIVPTGETWVADADLYVTAAGVLTTTAESNTKIGMVVVGGAAGEVAAIQIG